MAEDPGALSHPSPGHTTDKTTMPEWSGEAELAEFDRIFSAMMSSDVQKRHEAGLEYDLIPPCRKASLLLKQYKTATIDESRYEALHHLQLLLQHQWDGIFPQPSTDEKLADFSRALLDEAEYASCTLLGEKLAIVIAVVARGRRSVNSADWLALIDFIAQSPQSTASKHQITALAIVQAEPRIFEGHGEACHEFFDGCLKEEDQSLHKSILQAYVEVYSSCTNVQEHLNQLEQAVSSMLRSGHIERDKETGTPASNTLANYFMELCLDSMDQQTVIMANKTIAHQVFELGEGCWENLKKLLELCLECPIADVRSVALRTYSYAMCDESATRSSLARLFPTILSMAECDVREEATDSPATSRANFRPLEALQTMAHRPCPLFEPHLLRIVALCRETVEKWHESNACLADSAYRTLCSVLGRHLDEMVAAFGEDFIKQTVEWTLEQSKNFRDSHGHRKLYGYLLLVQKLAGRELTAPQMKQFVLGCSGTNDPRLEQISLDILWLVPTLLDIPDVLARIERALSHPVAKTRTYLQPNALLALSAVARLLKTSEQRAETLAPIIALLIELCASEAATPHNRNDYTPLSCIGDFARTDVDLILPHLSTLISRLCELIVHGYTRHEEAMGLISDLCETEPEMIKTRAAGQIIDILECKMLEAAHNHNHFDMNMTGASWATSAHLQLCTKGAEKVDTVVRALRGPDTETGLVQMANKLSDDANWRKRYVSVVAVRALGALCTPSTIITQIAPFLIAWLSDPQPQVCNIACAAISQLAAIRAPIMQDELHDSVVPALISLLTTSSIPRLAAIAGATLAVFIENCPSTSTVDFKPVLLQICVHLQSVYLTLLVANQVVLLEQLFAPICALAKCFPLLVYANYEVVMEPLRQILHEKPGHEILCIVLKCAAHCGEAAGKSQFKADGCRVVSAVASNLASLLSGYEKFTDALEQVLAVIGEDAASSFLPDLMPPLIVALEQYAASFGVADAQRRHDVLRTRNAAMSMIKCLEETAGAAFKPYATAVASLARLHSVDKIE